MTVEQFIKLNDIFLQAVYDKESCVNYVQSQSRVLSNAVLNFQLNQDEINLNVSPAKTIIRNYLGDELGM